MDRALGGSMRVALTAVIVTGMLAVAGSVFAADVPQRQHPYENLHPGCERLERIPAGRRTVLVRDVAGVAEIDNRLRDEAVVQFLRAVELVAAGDAGAVEVMNPLDVVLDRRRDVPFHDLRVVD